MVDFANHLSRSLTSEFCYMTPGWAKRRKLTKDYTKYCEVFDDIICRFGKSNIYTNSMKRIILRNTRFENQRGVDVSKKIENIF